MRVIMTASKNGEAMDIHVHGGETFTFDLPRDKDQLQTFFEHLHPHLVDWFGEHIRHYEHGDYGGGNGMGFDLLEAEDVEQALDLASD